MSSEVNQPAPSDYMAFQYLNILSGDRLRLLLSDHGARGLSICPICKIGDFLHKQNCRLAMTKDDREKLFSVTPVSKILRKKALKNRTKGIRS